MPTLTQKEYLNIKERLEKLKIEWEESPLSEETRWLIESLGYLFVTYEDKPMNTKHGPIIMMANENNNGIYIFHLNDKAYLLEVIRPNTCDNAAEISKAIQQGNELLSQLDTKAFNIYDLIKIYSHLLVTNVIRPMAQVAFPNDKVKQLKYIDIYLPRLLSNMAHYYIGDDKQMEEAVVSEPYIVKLLIEGADQENTQPKKQSETTKGGKNESEME